MIVWLFGTRYSGCNDCSCHWKNREPGYTANYQVQLYNKNGLWFRRASNQTDRRLGGFRCDGRFTFTRHLVTKLGYCWRKWPSVLNRWWDLRSFWCEKLLLIHNERYLPSLGVYLDSDSSNSLLFLGSMAGGVIHSVLVSFVVCISSFLLQRLSTTKRPATRL